MTTLLLLTLLTPAQPGGDEVTLPAVERDGVRATLSIRVAEQTPVPGSARVRFRIGVEGPPGLRLDSPSLEDALSAWRVPVRTSSLAVEGQKAHWECTLALVQTKPGVVPLPGVGLRYFVGEKEQKISWPDPLNEPADVAPIVELPPLPPSPWPRRLRAASAVALGLASAWLAGLLGRRWLRRPARTPSPDAAALAEIDRLSAHTAQSMTNRIGQLDAVVRGYLEALNIPARRTTTAELLRLVEALGWMSPATQELLGAFLRHAEQAKFAGLEETDADANARTGEAREAVRAVAREAEQRRRALQEDRPAQENGTDFTTGVKSAV